MLDQSSQAMLAVTQQQSRLARSHFAKIRKNPKASRSASEAVRAKARPERQKNRNGWICSLDVAWQRTWLICQHGATWVPSSMPRDTRQAGSATKFILIRLSGIFREAPF